MVRQSLGDPACYRRRTRLLAAQATDEPHPTRMRTPAAPLRRAGRLCRGASPGRSRYSLVPSSVAIRRSAGSPPPREGPVRLGSRVGRVVRRFPPLRGGGPVAVAWTWDGASAPNPYFLRQPRADVVAAPDSLPGRGLVIGHRGPDEGGRGRRPIKRAGYRSYGPGHPGRTRSPLTGGCHRWGWLHRLPLGLGSPAAP